MSIRPGLDQDSSPQLRYRRATDTTFSRSPDFLLSKHFATSSMLSVNESLFIVLPGTSPDVREEKVTWVRG